MFTYVMAIWQLFLKVVSEPEVGCAHVKFGKQCIFLILDLECSNLQVKYISRSQLRMQKFRSFGALFTSFLGHFV
jgi:hypothetical protein